MYHISYEDKVPDTLIELTVHGVMRVTFQSQAITFLTQSRRVHFAVIQIVDVGVGVTGPGSGRSVYID